MTAYDGPTGDGELNFVAEAYKVTANHSWSAPSYGFTGPEKATAPEYATEADDEVLLLVQPRSSGMPKSSNPLNDGASVNGRLFFYVTEEPHVLELRRKDVGVTGTFHVSVRCHSRPTWGTAWRAVVLG